jgi:P4 family phage/plasmid primase-like protien
MSMPEFEFGKLNFYFYKGIISYDPITKIEYNFNLDVVYDNNQCFWKQNCVKFEMIDETKLVNHFKSNFDNSLSFLSPVVKNRILEAYRQYGRQKYDGFQEIPKQSVIFNNALVYFGNNIEEDIQIDKLCPEQYRDGLVYNPFTAFFITNPIPYEYKPNAEHSCPTIDNYFADWVGEDNKEILYELIAYCMLPDYPLHRIFLLFGSGRNGKSTYIRILEKVIGLDNITASDIHTLTEDRFGTANLYKKLVCYIGETDGHKLDRTSILKRLSGGDTINAQFKNKPSFNFRNYAKIIIATNTIPQMQDKTFGNMSRYIIIDFPKRYTEKGDILKKIPEAEFEALANICLEKLKLLLANNKFHNELSPEEKSKSYEEKSNPLGKFVELNCNLNYGSGIATYEFYAKYIDWLANNGYSTNVSKNAVIIDMQDKYEIIKSQRMETIFGESKRYYYFEGISWKTNKTIKSEEPEIITEDKEYTKQEIFDYFVQQNKIPKEKYDIDEAIRILKTKTQDIYEPRNGVYKINKGNNYGQSMDN